MASSQRAHRSVAAPSSVTALLDALDRSFESGEAREFGTVPTGFQPLDNVLGGGVRPGELILVGGSPGVGKTILTLQWARNMARDTRPVLYACYEHEEADLLVRLLAMEMGASGLARDEDTDKIRLRLRDAALGSGRGLRAALQQDGLARQAYEELHSYAGHLHLLKASGRHTGLAELEEMMTPLSGGGGVLFIDYLQKVAIDRDVPTEAEKVTVITEGLKELALELQVPVICVVAADKEGLNSPRLRLHHLRGSSALMFEADVVLILNDKYGAVSKVHRAYDPVHAAGFKDWVILSTEKNRSGPPGIDLEFQKDFAHFRFEPHGGVVSERLYDEREHPE